MNSKKKKEEWNGEIYRTTINKHVHTELFNELEKLPPNVRVKRLLLLATIGLTFVKSQNQIIQVMKNEKPNEVQNEQQLTENSEDLEFKNDTKNKLLSSLKF